MNHQVASDNPQPPFTAAEACALVQAVQRDQIFLLETEASPEFVLKIANAAERASASRTHPFLASPTKRQGFKLTD